MKSEAEIRLVLENITKAFNKKDNRISQYFSYDEIRTLEWVLDDNSVNWSALSTLERYIQTKKRKAPIEEHLLEYLDRIKQKND